MKINKEKLVAKLLMETYAVNQSTRIRNLEASK